MNNWKIFYTLPETNMAPENGWLEYDRFLLGRLGLFSGAKWLLVLGSVIFYNFLAIQVKEDVSNPTYTMVKGSMGQLPKGGVAYIFSGP